MNAEGSITRSGFQICHVYAELMQFIDWLRELSKDAVNEEIELVINGDIVDFLADDDYADPAIGAQVWTVDEAQAVMKFGYPRKAGHLVASTS